MAIVENVIKPAFMRFVEEGALVHAGFDVGILGSFVVDLVKLVGVERLWAVTDAGPNVPRALLAGRVFAEQDRSRGVANGG